MAKIRQVVLMLVLAAVIQTSAAGPPPKFFPDDPIRSMPPPLRVGTPVPREVSRIYEFFQKSHLAASPMPARAVNTLGEVPDNDWFTNRHGLRRMSRDQLQHGPGPAEGPQPPFTIIGGKGEGISNGFRMEDSKGRRYFAKVDPIDFPELSTAAEVIASKFIYAIGYNTPKNEILYVKLSDLRLSRSASITSPDGRSRNMGWKDVEQLFDGIEQNQDGSFRIVASQAVEGEYIGPFRYDGTRSDDPNDVVPHENRRDLRGLYVFSAWLNNTDPRSGNTLDTVVEVNGTRFIRHYLIDFGSSLGSNGDRSKDATASHEFAMITPSMSIKRILSLGVVRTPAERDSFFPNLRGVGRFSSHMFNPEAWKPGFPNPAFQSRLSDDDFWAAKQVMTFTDDDIHAIVETAKYSDMRSADYVAKTLAQRRDKIGRVFFSKILPLDNFRVENGELMFDDLAVKYGFRPARSYEVRWFRFDNNTQMKDAISGFESAHVPAEAMQASPDSYFCAGIETPGEPMKLSVYLRKERNDFKVVGIDRTW